MLMSREAIAEVVEVLDPDHFYKPAHGHLYDAIMGLYGSGQPADVVTVAEELDRANLLEEIGGPSTLLDLQSSTPAISNAAHYAKIVEEHALLRRLISVSNEIAEMAYDVPDDVIKAVDEAEAKMFEVAQRRVTNTTAQIKDLLSANLDRLEMLYERGEEITGTRTGYTDLDRLLAGLQPHALYVIGARPAMGKALALDTPIPTPNGWTTMGELRVGDQVYDEQGAPTNVTYTSPVYVDHQCFRVTFDDGTELVADAEHQWLTCDDDAWQRALAADVDVVGLRPADVDVVGLRPDMAIRTTAEIAATVSSGATGGPNHRIPLCGPGDRPEVDLPADPYRLGANLGMGCQSPAAGAIPEAYLRASFKQRLALLQGLMDTSGMPLGAGPATVELSLADRALLEQARDIVLSLGYKAQPISHPDGAPTASLTFTPLDPVFRLRSKAEAQRFPPADCSSRWRLIVAVEPVPSVPVQCITVDSPEHLYLAGREMVPTHNTAFALGMAANAAMAENKPVLFFSLEMGQLELSQRILCSQALVDSSRVKTGRIEEPEWNRISHAVGMLAEAPIHIDDNPQTSVMEIRAKARRLKSRVGELGMVVVDYIQLMSGRSNAESRQVEVSEISRGLKILAREIETPVVALAQLNRGLEQRIDKRPMLSDLRESGSLEQDADVVMFLYRDEVYDPDSPDRGVAEVLVAKHRNGPTGRVKLAFRGQYTRFDDMAAPGYGGGPPPGADDGPPAPPPEEF
jgi:replicative DNA helicase